MVRIEEIKITKDKSIQKVKPPSKVYIPLIQHTGKVCTPLVKSQDFVKIGQKIATCDSGIFAPIHSSISGKVIDICDWPHPVLGKAKAIVIESDGLDKSEIQIRNPKLR
jgi:electron transport complex protein RnfC